MLQLFLAGGLLSLYLIVGLITGYKYYEDKSIAIHNGEGAGPNKRRTSERELLFWMCCFGVYGAGFSMQVFRHKTQKPLFNSMLTAMLMFHTILIIIGMYFIF
jgi:uncharacterized membrane protein YsdA (DUF1294 family)